MKKVVARSLFAIATLGVAAGVSAQLKPEEMIKFRQSGYTFMAWNMGKIKAMAVDEKVPFDAKQVSAAADVVAAVANSGMGALYSKETLDGTGWKKTRLKPEFFDKMDEVKEVAVNFVKQANELKKVAATGDQAAIKAQFGETGKACKACHDKFRMEEDK
ncbi:MAG: cytochrome c [Rhodocyclaceae bacterium]|nr:cytochrome c [Rhodocyclaceae bacterium]